MIINTRTVKSIRDSRTGKYYSPAARDGWATRLTNIKTDAGKSAERKAQRKLIQGKKYTNRASQRRQSYNEHKLIQNQYKV